MNLNIILIIILILMILIFVVRRYKKKDYEDNHRPSPTRRPRKAGDVSYNKKIKINKYL